MGKGFDLERWEAVVFDVDGTLYEQRALRRKMLVELALYCAMRPWRVGMLRRLQTFRRQRERLAEEEAVGVSRLQYEQPARRLGISAEGLEAEVAEWIERRPLRHLAACRVAGARRFFDRLRGAGVAVAALSDYPAEKKLDALGLEADLIVSAVDPEVDRFKPQPQGLEAVIERLGVAPERALMIGDRDDRDGECARRAGVRSLLRAPGGPSAADTFATYVDLLD